MDVPSGIKSGSLHYYSPALIAEKERKGLVTLHSATLFDYFFMFNKSQSAQQRKKFVISQGLAGLLAMILEYEQKPSNVKVVATSYILNPRTAKRLGLKKVDTNFAQLFILSFNYLNLTLSQSFLNKKLSWPNLAKVSTYEANINDLIAAKQTLINLQKRMNSHATD